jgi:hypothetical protein
MGMLSLKTNTTGSYNTALGDDALQANTTASYNTAVGYQALRSNTTGTRNVALGFEASYSNTTASYNIAIGYRALYDYATGSGENIAIGDLALNNLSSGYENIAIGRGAGLSLTNATRNTLIGDDCGNYITTGAKNTILGRYGGNQGGLDIRTSSNNIVLSDGDGNPRVRVDNAGQAHFGQAGTAGDGIYVHVDTNKLAIQSKRDNDGDHIRFYNGSGSIAGNIGVSGSSTYYNTSSDHRLKENVDYTWDATTRLKQLKPARFNFIADADTTVDGFLAHEVQTVVPEAISGTHNEVDDEGNPVYQGIDHSKLVPLLVKTIQELEARITALEGA